MAANENPQWLKWAVELQALAQTGLYYDKGAFAQERFERIREIAAEMIAHQAEVPLEKAKDIFCCDIGYQTPKIETRAAIFRGDKILLVKEWTGKWAMPGGWVDVGLSVKENAIKEAKEEAGLDVTADLVIAVQDREKHNRPIYIYKICKVFILCAVTGGEFQPNSETTASQYFGLDELPPLALEKNNEEQLRMCFEAYRHADTWKTLLD